VHGGGINGFATFIARYPDEKATVIVLCNNEEFDVGSVAADLAAILFDAKYEIAVALKLAKVDPDAGRDRPSTDIYEAREKGGVKPAIR
jgi:hypothetical protein